MTTPIFDNSHPKIIEITFSFPEFALAYNKPVYSICSFITEIQSNLELPFPSVAMPNQKYFD